MNLNHLTDDALRISSQKATQNERAATSLVLHHLREVDRRRLYSKWKYQDLKSYAVDELKYTEDEAWLRISAMRFLKDLPELEERINNGALKLSTLVLAKRAFAVEAKQTSVLKPQIELENQLVNLLQFETTAILHRTKEDKLRIIEKLENVSKREAIKIIETETGVSVKSQESIRPLSNGTFEMKFIVTKDVLKNIDKAKGLLAHSHPNISQGKLLELALTALIKEIDPTAKAKKTVGKFEANSQEPSKACSTVPEQSRQGSTQQMKRSGLSNSTFRANSIHNAFYNSSYIPSAVRHHVWIRDEGKCTNCKSNYAVQYEHVAPLAKGGKSTPENLKLLCRNCNQRSAIEQFGIKKISRYLKDPNVDYH